MTISPTQLSSTESIPIGKLAYFRTRLRMKLRDLVVTEFLRQKDSKGLTQSAVAQLIGKKREQVNRWFGAPGNWTLDTASDLLLAMGAVLEVSIVYLDGPIVVRAASSDANGQVLGGSQAVDASADLERLCQISHSNWRGIGLPPFAGRQSQSESVLNPYLYEAQRAQ